MKTKTRFAAALACALIFGLTFTNAGGRAADALPSWNDGAAKQAIIAFVQSVTSEGRSTFVPVADRVAVFDNDGTLWSEQPIYFQVAFALDRVKVLAPKHPEWKTTQPFKGVLDNDMKAALAGGERSVMAIMAASHAGVTADEFTAAVTDWLKSATHPRFKRPYTELVYQPMLEVLAYLRENGFKTYVVSGGGVEFMRVFAEQVYGIPPEQVIGSRIKMQYAMRNGKPELLRLPQIDFIDDKEGKPIAINATIGRRPIMAFGNSDGDFQMLEWTTSGTGPRFALIVHHTDAEREWAYDRTSHIGQLVRGLDEAPKLGWTVADMKKDWNAIYPAAKQ
jgi:phosphoglycolate phosphatase-like HAD superfamily hydrolase